MKDSGDDAKKSDGHGRDLSKGSDEGMMTSLITMTTMLKMMKIGDEVLMIEFLIPSPWRLKLSFIRSVL